MRLFAMKGVVAFSALAALMLTTGCASNKADKPAMSARAPIAVVTPHGQVAIYTFGSNNTPMMMMMEPGMAECAQCKMDLENYGKTGKIDEVCSVCGAHRKVMSYMSHGHQ
jgi:hypothetical protein